jgi:hypothetical protein
VRDGGTKTYFRQRTRSELVLFALIKGFRLCAANYNDLHTEVLRVRFEVLITMGMKNCLLQSDSVFCRVTVGGHCISNAAHFFTLKKETVASFDTSLNFCHIKRSHIPEDIHHNAAGTSHLINYKQIRAQCYLFYSNWWRCRISMHIPALLCIYFHVFSPPTFFRKLPYYF